MTSASRARALLRLARIAAPPERQEWAQAMEAELVHLPERDAVAFARGCLWATVRARAASAAFILHSARWTLVAGAIAWAGLNLRLAERLWAADATPPATLAYAAAAIFALGALATARLGLRATFVLAAPAMVLAGLCAAGADALLPQSPHVTLYRALATEDLVILLVAASIALCVPRWVAARERASR